MEGVMNTWMIGAALLLTAGPAAAQDTPDLLRRYGTADSDALFDVKTAAVQRTGIAVLTDPDPAINVFGRRGTILQWGRSGNGPAELISPVDIAWIDDRILVLDVNQRKIVSYTSDGRFESSRSLDGIYANACS
jgi:hypothetical protein